MGKSVTLVWGGSLPEFKWNFKKFKEELKIKKKFSEHH